MPLLYHPLTVEGQGGPPLSAGPAALNRKNGLGFMFGAGGGLDPLSSLINVLTGCLFADQQNLPLDSLLCHPTISAAAAQDLFWTDHRWMDFLCIYSHSQKQTSSILLYTLQRQALGEVSSN